MAKWIELYCCILVLLFSAYAEYKQRTKLALALLLLGSFFIRLYASSLDPFLNEWDEHYHALVAKNMVGDPFFPHLQLYPVLQYDYRLWCCNYVWVHKQPLFLWLIAASIKIFGNTELAVRIPSILYGVLTTYLVYDLAALLTGKKRISYLAAFTFCLLFYDVQLTAGARSTDHNDTAFIFFTTASIWAFVNLYHKRKLKWSLLLGLSCGAAILCKWLPGMVIYAGFGVWFIQEKDQSILQHLLVSLLTTVAIALPWQLYTHFRFGSETSWEQQFNIRHFTEPLENHSGTSFFYISQLPFQYGIIVLPFLLLGLVTLKKYIYSKVPRLTLVAIILLWYLFFSLAKTKMPSFTMPMAPLFCIAIASGMFWAVNWLAAKSEIRRHLLFSLSTLLLLMSQHPWQLITERESDLSRPSKIHNTTIYKSLPDSLARPDVILINCKSFQNVDVMFYKNINAYHWYPEEKEIDSVIAAGYKIYAFTSFGDQILPAYITNNKAIHIINQQQW